MSVTVDSQKCTGCFLCLPVCPEKTLTRVGEKVLVTGGKCMVCGHCQAACPVDAIGIEGLLPGLDLQNLSEKEGVTPPGEFDSASLVQLMRSRRSCRNYLVQDVEESLLEDLVKIGTTAPSGTNSQSWSFVILPTRKDVEFLGSGVASFYRRLNKMAKNPFYRFVARLFSSDSLQQYYNRYFSMVEEALREWDETREDRLFHGAVASIVIMGEKSASCPAEDALLATQNILLAAHTLGLGSCLIGFAVEAVRRTPELQTLLKISKNMDIYSVIALGYPDEKFCHPAGRKEIIPTIIQNIHK